MISSLSLENFRSHAKTQVHFRRGTNLIIGIMGAGKSSILDGICFALFGTFPALERRKRKLEDVIKNGQDMCKVRMECTHDGHEYAIERVVERAKKGVKSDAYAYKDGKLVDSTTTSVNEFIKSALGIDYELYTRAIYSEQNHIDHFLSLDPKARKEEMDRLLGLDRFETARANATTVHNRIKSMRSTRSQDYDPVKHQEMKNRIAKLTQDIVANITHHETLKKNSLERETEMKNLETELLELTKAKTTFESHATKEIVLDGRIKELSMIEPVAKEMLEKQKASLVSIEEQISKELQTLKERSEEYNSLARLHGAQTEAIKQAEKEKMLHENCTKERNSILNERTYQELLTTMEKEQQTLLEVKTQVETYRRNILEITRALAHNPVDQKCPVCSHTLEGTSWETIKAHKQTEKEKAEVGMKEAERKIIQSTTRIGEFTKATERIRVLDAQLATIKQMDVEAHRTTQKELEAKGAQIKAVIDSLQKSVEELRKRYKEGAIAYAANEKAHVSFLRKQELERELETLKKNRPVFNKERFDTIAKDMANARILYETLKKDMHAITLEKGRLEAMQKELHEFEQNFAKIKEELSSLETLEGELGIYKQALLETQAEMRARLVESLNATMNNVWSVVYPYRDYRNIRLVATEKDYACEVFDGEWKTLEGVASGGERACAALVLRVALSMVLTPSFALLVLDEPTHNLDKDAIELLSQTLQFKVPEVIGQTIVITHEEGLMGSEFASSYRLTRNKGLQESTVIEDI